MESHSPQIEPRGTASLPLVRLNLIQPFVDMLDRVRVDANAVLSTNGLVRETVADPNVFVPSIVIHRFLEDAARAANDTHLGVRVGESLDLAAWPPFVDAVTHATTLMELLVRFIWAAKDEASSAQHLLEVGATCAYFREVRTSEHQIAPAQNDGFTAAVTLNLLRRAAASQWNPEKVRLTVCDPAALPERYLGVHIIGGDRMGMVVRFPAEWLLMPVDRRALVRPLSQCEQRLRLPVEFLDALRQMIELNVDNPDLGVDYVAHLFGMSRQTLQRKLKASGTTLSTEIADVRRRRAAERLVNTNESIAEISASLGFDNPTSFTRAFKAWFGESPRRYRRNQSGR